MHLQQNILKKDTPNLSLNIQIFLYIQTWRDAYDYDGVNISFVIKYFQTSN